MHKDQYNKYMRAWEQQSKEKNRKRKVRLSEFLENIKWGPVFKRAEEKPQNGLSLRLKKEEKRRVCVCVCVWERDTVGFNQQQVVCNEITTQST